MTAQEEVNTTDGLEEVLKKREWKNEYEEGVIKMSIKIVKDYSNNQE